MDDGSSGLQVDGGISTGGTVSAAATVMNANTLAGSGVVTIGAPGFYFVPATGSSGQGSFTGSVPSPGLFPGSRLILVETFGVFNWLLTGSAYQNGRALFCAQSGSFPGVAPNKYAGGTISLAPSGSVMLESDGFRWCVTFVTGAFSIAGNNF